VSTVGCSDGSREGFLPMGDFPRIAGCGANWKLASMRAPTTGAVCGTAIGVDCEVPADACAEGWHVCASPPRGAIDVYNKATAAQCRAQPGAFAAAVGDVTCECDAVDSQTACCGSECVETQGDCLYPGETAAFEEVGDGQNLCGAIEARSLTSGVMCCRDS
jgi:hypothetical protein